MNAPDQHVIATLFRLAQQRDADAWQALMEWYHDRLTALVVRKIPAEVRLCLGADDVLQEIFLAVWLGLPRARFESLARFQVWLMRVARHCVVDAVRRVMSTKRGLRAVNRAAPTLDDLAGNGSSPSRGFERGEARHCVQRILDRLPERYRAALELVHIDRLKTAEAAAVLGISGVALRKRLERALNLCQDIVQSESFDGWRDPSARPAV